MRGPILALGQYEVGDLIATGGMAAVYRARTAGPMGFEKPVAVKVLLDEAAEDPEIVRMFIDEARLGARLNHQNIASVLDFGEADGRYYLAMEYVDGTSLAGLLKAMRQGRRAKSLDVRAIVYVTQCVLRALAYAHSLRDEKGKSLAIVHRDVSPHNILLDRSGAVKLCDFGIATGAYRVERTEVGLIKGKVAFMSPEQALGERLDARSDLYSLGLTVVAMLGGLDQSDDSEEAKARAAKGFDLARVQGLDAPEPLREVLKKALARSPSDRFQSADEFLQAITDAGLDPGEAGRLALVEAMRAVPAPRARKGTRAKESAPPVREAPAGVDRGYRNLLFVVAGILLLALLFALFGLRLPPVGESNRAADLPDIPASEAR